MALVDISQLLDKRRILWGKFRGAVINAAASIYAEAPDTTNHANRLIWAQDVLLEGNVDKRTEELYRLGMTNPDIVSGGESAPDATVEYIVALFLNTVARG